MNILRIAAILALIGLGLGVYGCKDAGVSPPPPENLRLSVKAPATVLGKVNHEVLHIISAKVLLREIEFSQAGSEDSVEIESGPQVVSLNLDAKITEVAAVRIRPGVYDRIRFTIHKPEDSEQVSDSTFKQGESGNERFSLVITGLYHDTPFTFKSRESTRQELQLTSPVTVSEDGTVNVTLKIDPYLWFQNNGLVLDPFNQTKEIDDLVKSSFAEAFRDNDRNGDPD
jgi:hypothetical protein